MMHTLNPSTSIKFLDLCEKLNSETSIRGGEEHFNNPQDSWSSPLRFNTWENFTGNWMYLDKYNELVSYWFEFNKDEPFTCLLCDGKNRLGAKNFCFSCHGAKLTRPQVALHIWMIHPRKSASRSITIDNIYEDQIVDVIRFLRQGLLHHLFNFKNLQLADEYIDKYFNKSQKPLEDCYIGRYFWDTDDETDRCKKENLNPDGTPI